MVQFRQTTSGNHAQGRSILHVVYRVRVISAKKTDSAIILPTTHCIAEHALIGPGTTHLAPPAFVLQVFSLSNASIQHVLIIDGIGYETDWDWVLECEASGSSSWACGNITDGEHEVPSCPGSAKTQAISIQTTETTSSAGRYTSPPPIDTSLYSVFTSTYTTIMTADAQTTTLTSVFASTFTSTLSRPSSSGASSTNTAGAAAAAASSSNAPATGTKRVTLTLGVIVAIIVGPTLALAIGLGVFFFMRRSRKNAGIRLNSSSPPPPNGPVGADQVNPYEMDVYEAQNQPRKKYDYAPPSPSAHEVNGFKEEKTWVRPAASEMGADELRSPRSPAPVYSEAVVPVELDDTSCAFRGWNEHRTLAG